ncbi:MAG: hypothetical protein AB7E51_13135 [Pseudodesulfovibrio sp.]|uniref:hypothetical protein n=1 Tax=Pseudodesulfovibrio sp. TaxID=2035812 RepID=UPI003D0ED5D7
MLAYLGFDDTDDHDSVMGTGRLVREFARLLPTGHTLIGIIRHQLPRMDSIPFTSNNSSACAVVDVPEDGERESLRLALRDLAADYLAQQCAPGSDPGLCLAFETEVTPGMVEFGKRAAGVQLTQRDAMDAARPIDLLGLGGTNDGIIGAMAAVGLTRYGWCGRFIEYGRLRELPASLTVRDLLDTGIEVVSVDRDPLVPQAGDSVLDAAWIRPSLWGGRPVLQVRSLGLGVWEPAHSKRGKGAGHGPGLRKDAVRTPGIAG